MQDLFDKYLTWNFWFMLVFLEIALVGPHSNVDAYFILLGMMQFYFWVKEDLKLA